MCFISSNIFVTFDDEKFFGKIVLMGIFEGGLPTDQLKIKDLLHFVLPPTQPYFPTQSMNGPLSIFASKIKNA